MMISTNRMQPNGRSLAQSTMLLVLSAETVLFGTLVMSYLYLRTGGSKTPFTHLGTSDLVIASINTLILLISAAFNWSAVRSITVGQIARLKSNLLVTLVFGTIFIVGQLIEFNHSGMKLDDSAFGGAFFALISFHVLHVLAGMTVLGLNFMRAQVGDFNVRRHVAITIGAWFWYYVIVVWIILFCVLYVV